jgi:hypothetical protein
VTSASEAAAIRRWFESELPPSWTQVPPEVVVDNDEILVVITVAVPSPAPAGDDGTCDDDLGVVAAWRAATRDERVALAGEAERRFRRKVSWAARAGDVVATFTTVSVPVMTRLRLGERRVLDTLIDAGIARSRSDALAWCVRLVGENEQEWMAELRAAFASVESVRERGPRANRNRDQA